MSVVRQHIAVSSVHGTLTRALSQQVASIEREVFGTSGCLKHAQTFVHGHWFLGNASNQHPHMKVDGYALLTGDENDSRSLCLDDLAVLPSARRHGLGSRLVCNAIAFARRSGNKVLFTFVRVGDENENFYTHLGFLPVAGTERTSACYPGEVVRRWELGDLGGEGATCRSTWKRASS